MTLPRENRCAIRRSASAVGPSKEHLRCAQNHGEGYRCACSCAHQIRQGDTEGVSRRRLSIQSFQLADC